MASKKDKLLESAQKFIVKGQIDRALKDYEQIVGLEPGDMRHRQKYAELLVRGNCKEEAINQYEQIGRFYSDGGHFSKAIAVYKQVQKLDPSNLKTTLSLASLNHKQGMTGNALNEYGVVLTEYENTGKYQDALKLVETMLELDPVNVGTLMRKGGVLYRSGSREDAYAHFCQLIQTLRKQGDKAGLAEVMSRVSELFPDRVPAEEAQTTGAAPVAEEQTEIGRLCELLKQDSSDLRLWLQLVDAYRQAGDAERVRKTCQHMLKLFPADLAAIGAMVQSVLDDGDGEEGINLLNRYEPNYFAQGAIRQLEGIYLALQDLMPGDFRVQEGLRRVYESLGENDKLTELSGFQEEPEVYGEQPFQEPDFDEQPLDQKAFEEALDSLELELPEEPDQPPVADNSLALTAEPALVAGEFEWEEEIDLGLADEAAAELSPAGTEEAETDEGTAAVAGPEEKVELEFEPGGAVEFEFSFSEEEAAEEPLSPQPDSAAPAEPPDFGELDLEEPREEAAGPVAVSVPGEGEPSGLSDWEAAGDAELTEEEPPALDEFFDQLDALLPEEPEQKAGGAFNAELDEVFEQFEKSAEPPLDLAELESHYDLGIAYKDMGLLDEAIKEFQTAAKGPRRIDCLTLQAGCYREKEMPDMAEQLLKVGMATEGVSADEMLSLRYELGLLYESTGRTDEALFYFEEIYKVNRDIHDVSRRIATLKGEEETHEIIDLDLEDLEELD